MDMEVADPELILFDDGEDPVDLVKGDAKFPFVVTGGNLEIAARHDIGSQTDADRIAMPEFFSEFLQVGQAVDIDDHPQGAGFFDLVESDAVGGIEDALRGKARMQGKPGLVDGTAIHVGAQGADPLEDIYIGERFTGVEK